MRYLYIHPESGSAFMENELKEHDGCTACIEEYEGSGPKTQEEFEKEALRLGIKDGHLFTFQL